MTYDTLIEKVFNISQEIKYGEFSEAELNAALQQMKNGQAHGLDGLHTCRTMEVIQDQEKLTEVL